MFIIGIMPLFFKSFFSLAVLLAVFFLFNPSSVKAQYQLDEFAGTAGYPTDNSATLENKSQQIVNIVLSLTGILFLGMSIYAGIKWMTARGNEENVTTAKETLEAAIIGMVIISISYAVSNVIFQKIQGQ